VLYLFDGSWGPGVVLGVPAPDPDPEAPPDAEPEALPLPLMPPLDPLGLEAGGVVAPGLWLLLELLEPGLVGLLLGGEDFEDDPDDDPPWFAPRSHAASASAAATAAARLRNLTFNMVEPPWLSRWERHCAASVVPERVPFGCVVQ
jgi:hypothetical protein